MSHHKARAARRALPTGAGGLPGCRLSSTPIPSDHSETWQCQLGTREGLIPLWHCSLAPAGCPLLHPPSAAKPCPGRTGCQSLGISRYLLTPAAASSPHVPQPHRNLAVTAARVQVQAPGSSMSESPRFPSECHQVRVESPQHIYLQPRNARSELQPPRPGQSRL